MDGSPALLTLSEIVTPVAITRICSPLFDILLLPGEIRNRLRVDLGVLVRVGLLRGLLEAGVAGEDSLGLRLLPVVVIEFLDCSAAGVSDVLS